MKLLQLFVGSIFLSAAATVLAQSVSVDKSIAVSRLSENVRFVLQDGSVVSGKVDLKNFDLVTSYGQLSIPISDILRVRFARKPDTELKKRIARHVADLGNSDFNTRDAAMQELIKLGRKAFAELEQACISDDPEVRTRAGKIMETIQVSDDEDPVLEDDEVVTKSVTLRGTLKPEVFSVQSKLGVLRIDKFDALTMTSAVDEYTKQCRLTGNYVVAKAFLDTKIVVRKGDRLDFTATGLLNYPSTKQTFLPEGKADAGLWQEIPFGAVVGRVGASGPVFRIGEKNSIRVEQDGPLFLSIAHNAADAGATGWYKVRISHQPAPVLEAPKP